MDIVTYALLKNQISNMKTGIKSIVSNDNKLIFTLADNSQIEVEIPQAKINISNSLTNFPLVGDMQTIYIARDNLKIYIWKDNSYTSLTKSQDDLEQEIENIKKALGANQTTGEMETVQNQVTLYAKDGFYKKDENGNNVSIEAAISDLEEFNNNLQPFTKNEVKNLFLT